MIVSASYKTDIPAFYGPWFMNRLEAGSCKMVNPYGGQIYTVPLTPGAVDGLVFWTKNLGPFLDSLEAVRARGFPFAVQYTINNYPRALESSVTDADRSGRHMRRLAQSFGPHVGVWRYDPVIVTSLTPPDWHVPNFERLAGGLAGLTDEVVISFAHFYLKTRRNLAAAGRALRFDWSDPDDSWKRETTARLAEIAAGHGMRLTPTRRGSPAWRAARSRPRSGAIGRAAAAMPRATSASTTPVPMAASTAMRCSTARSPGAASRRTTPRLSSCSRPASGLRPREEMNQRDRERRRLAAVKSDTRSNH
jgi:hypothetical protein